MPEHAMKTQSPDTPPEIEEILLEGNRRMSPVEKLRQMAAMLLAQALIDSGTHRTE